MNFAGLLVGLATVVLAGCVGLPTRLPASESQALEDVAGTALARTVARSAPPGALPALTGIRLLPEADFSLDARIALARAAQKSLDVQYYLLAPDEVGLLLLRELRHAAERGVRVRVILDDLYNGGEHVLFNAFAAHPNVELRIFNPLPARNGGLLTRLALSLHEFGRINHRMHNKLFIADNSVSVSGGRNIAQEYFMRAADANFIDMDVLATGAAVRAQSASFDAYWNSEHVYPIGQLASSSPMSRFDSLAVGAAPDPAPRSRDVLNRSAVAQQLADGRLDLVWAQAEVYADAPAKIGRKDFESRFAGSVTQRTLAVIGSARSRVVIISPYFIPGDIGMGVIEDSGARGVVTVVLTNSLGATDEPLVYAGYARYRRAMLEKGVLIHEFGPGLSRQSAQYGSFGNSTSRLHAKMAVIDGRWMFIGSMNLDGRSASYNTEIGLLIDGAALKADFDQLSTDRFTSAYQVRLGRDGGIEWVRQDADGRQTVYDDEPDAGWFLAFRNWLLSPLVREELL
ncbi:phospholipase D family protein [Variovorax sp. J22P168]|uniref:phospholipase D-like domain-containing protein n=1 Tax=Variovorax jilinensis TaxID=3053513 RepID=UPI002575B742|nr:phospholipase D family protein [Variovorax sp. J22P168]MDM0015672.1 phospholipase D family protein [Variovorax sp. J22P168]